MTDPRGDGPAPPSQAPTEAGETPKRSGAAPEAPPVADGSGAGSETPSRRRRRRRRRRPGGVPAASPNGGGVPTADEAAAPAPPQAAAREGRRRERRSGGRAETREVRGILELGKGGAGFLRSPEHDLRERPEDVQVPAALVKRLGLKPGAEVVGRAAVQGRQARLEFVDTVEGMPPGEFRKKRSFKRLTVIDPDFQYQLGPYEQEGQLSMRIVDLLAPVGRGQRGLVVAPPRTGKTTLMMNVAAAMQGLYPDVHLIVLLIDERPEEATYWRRNVKGGEVFVSTMDASPKAHVRLAELVQQRAERLVEAGKEVMILLDSITRLTRAYNNVLGSKNARTMSGGLDSRVFQKPKHFFGAARNTEDAGSLTILATALVETGSKMDQVIYEEFKGTGNLELTLDRRLADRRIFPAIDLERTGTRKEEKLLGRQTLRKVEILRRVLARMRPREAMEMLVDRLGRYPSNQDFLDAFSLDDVE